MIAGLRTVLFLVGFPTRGGLALALVVGSSGVALAEAPVAPSSAPAPSSSAPASSAPSPRAEAESLLRQRRYPEAVALLRQAVASDPRDAELAMLLGLALDAAGAHDESEAALRAAVALAPRRAAAYVALVEQAGRSASLWRRQDELRAWLDRGFAATEGLPEEQAALHLAAGELSRRLGRWAEARDSLQAAARQSKSPSTRARAGALLEGLAAEEARGRFHDWPALAPSSELRKARAQAALDLAAGRPAAVLASLAPLLARAPADAEALLLLARALEALGRHDEAAATCTRALQLVPSRADGWRLLGTILATHGGALEAERADEALRRALALEPSWEELRALRREVAAKRASRQASGRGEPAPPPSPRALTLFEDGRHWIALDAPELAEASWREALRDSPGYVEAAVALFGLGRELPDEVMRALANDGRALASLGEAARTLRTDGPGRGLARRWLDRAVALGAPEGWYQRALLREGEGDRAGALDDLEAYVASDVEPPHLAQARALRGSLLAAGEGAGADDGSLLARARLALMADRPDDAERLLGGPCRAGLAPIVALALGQVRAYRDDKAGALACYELLMPAEPSAVAREGDATLRDLRWQALGRAARLLARAPLLARDAPAWEARLGVASREGLVDATLALAVLAREHRRVEEARSLLQSYLQLAPADDGARPFATTLAAAWAAEDAPEEHARAARRGGVLWAAAIAAAALLLAGFLVALARRWSASSIRSALRAHPELYPALVKLVGEVRHDLLKHRASALSLLADEAAAQAQRRAIARTLLEPTPVSTCLAEAYERFRAAAGALGVSLRPLAREPDLRGLFKDLRRAERKVNEPRALPLLRAIDGRVRGVHARALAALLAAGPTTRVDEAWVGAWLAGPAGSRAGAPTPDLRLAPGGVTVAIDGTALASALGNLLRNAEDAVRGRRDARLAFEAKVERDVVGRRSAVLAILDDAPRALTVDEIESRAADRGLGVVREVARAWGGQVVVRAAAAPFVKAVGLALPLGQDADPQGAADRSEG